MTGLWDYQKDASRYGEKTETALRRRAGAL